MDPITQEVLDRWESVLTRLEADPMLLRRELDWVAKLELLEGYRQRDNLDWEQARLHLVDLQYSDVRAGARASTSGWRRAGASSGSSPTRRSWRAVDLPPEDTRAYFRGRCLDKYADSVAAASWDSVIFDLPERESLQRIPTLDPLRGTKQHVQGLIERCRTASDLVRELTAS